MSDDDLEGATGIDWDALDEEFSREVGDGVEAFDEDEEEDAEDHLEGSRGTAGVYRDEEEEEDEGEELEAYDTTTRTDRRIDTSD